MSRARILTSAACLVFVNGKIYSQISDFAWNSDTPKKAIYCVDQMEPAELAPTTVKTGFTMSLYRVKGSAGARGAGMVGTFPDLSRERYFSVMIVDRENGLVVFRADECSAESEHWNAPAKSMVTGSLSVSCLAWSDEMEPLQS